MERHPISYHSSKCLNTYHFIGSFEAHDVDGVCSDGDEEYAHDVVVERSPMSGED